MTSVFSLVTPEIQMDHWFYVFFLIVAYCLISLTLALVGDHPVDIANPVRLFFHGISSALERGTGYPGWAMAGALSGLAMLGTVALGFYWDVAWHIDLGRDREVFTPSHTMIVLGLAGLMWAALIAIVFATNDRANVGFRVGGLRVPWSALSLGALGAGGLLAFPFDVMWHEAYGIDVTLWSPSHLMLLGGGSLATISLWLMFAEARRDSQPTWLGKGIVALVAGTILVGVSTFQGEFDFGVPQFQALYWPLLVVGAAAFALTAARISLGAGGAVAAVTGYLVVRGIIALIVAGSLNHTVPRFPLYVASALVIEAVAWALGTRNRVRFALVSAAGVATIGLAGEVAFASASGWMTPAGGGLWWKVALLAPLAAGGAALLGTGLARAYSGADIPPWLLALGGLALIVTLAIPWPRHVGDVDATIRLLAVSEAEAARTDTPGIAQAFVEVELSPPDAAADPVAFGVTSWQGGGRISASLDEVEPGRYVSSRPLPIEGEWKTTVGLLRGSEVMAAPVYLPQDDFIDAPEIPALPVRETSFVRNTDLLLREVHDGPLGPALASYIAVAVVVMVWVWLFALTAIKVGPGDGGDGGDDGDGWSPPATSAAPPAAVNGASAPTPVATGFSGWWYTPESR